MKGLFCLEGIAQSNAQKMEGGTDTGRGRGIRIRERWTYRNFGDRVRHGFAGMERVTGRFSINTVILTYQYVQCYY